MGKDLYDSHESVRAIFDKADQVLGRPISKICFEGPQEELTKTINAQPGIFLVSAALLTLLNEEGIKPSIVAGHSLGEITAYYASGVLSLEDALLVIKERGEGMAKSYPSEKSAMAAVLGANEDTINTVLGPFKNDPLVCANFNCPGQIVISGQKASMDNAIPKLKEQGAKVIPLNVSGAFHSPLMQAGSDHLKAFIDSVTFNDAMCPIVLNRSAQQEHSPIALKENLPQQVVSSVQWIKSIESISNDVDAILECGPGMVLTGLIKKIDSTITRYSVSNVDTLTKFLATVRSEATC